LKYDDTRGDIERRKAMAMKRALIICLLLFSGLAGRALAADDAATLLLDGLVKQPQNLTAEDLRGMPPMQREIAFQTEHGEHKATYTGALLWDVVQRAAVNDPAKWGELRHVMAITGKDGYVVMFSLGEIDPNFGNAPIMIAYEQNGKPIEGGGLRLVVPGDRHGARDIRDVVHIEIR
jgi:DMSO/TMAO reductase YedYZ molybdopterin-dependent catalytic subunit